MGWLRSAVIGAARAIVPAVVLVHLLVAVEVVRVAPSSGLLASVWRVVVIDQGVWLLVAVVALGWALRPPTDAAVGAWLERRDLPASLEVLAGRQIGRVRRWRVLPTLMVWLWMPATGAASNLAIAEFGFGSAVVEQFDRVTAGGTGLMSSGLPLVAAYLAGAVAGELTRRAPVPTGMPSARLEVRRPGSYLVRWAQRAPWIAAGVLVAFTVLRMVVGVDAAASRSGVSSVVLLAVAVGTLLLGLAVQRLVVRRPQRIDDEALLALDDVARSSTAHAVAGAITVVQLGLASMVVSDPWNASLDGPRLLGWVLLPVGLVLFAATIGVWQRYGSAHPGTRPGGRAQAT